MNLPDKWVGGNVTKFVQEAFLHCVIYFLLSKTGPLIGSSIPHQSRDILYHANSRNVKRLTSTRAKNDKRPNNVKNDLC